MKKLLFLAIVLVLLMSKTQAQSFGSVPGGLTYQCSTTPPPGHSAFGVVVDNGTYTMYLNFPPNVTHAAYANVMGGGYEDVNNYGTSSVTFTAFEVNYFSPSVYLQWAIDYDDGTWEVLSGYVSNISGSFEVN